MLSGGVPSALCGEVMCTAQFGQCWEATLRTTWLLVPVGCCYQQGSLSPLVSTLLLALTVRASIYVLWQVYLQPAEYTGKVCASLDPWGEKKSLWSQPNSPWSTELCHMFQSLKTKETKQFDVIFPCAIFFFQMHIWSLLNVNFSFYLSYS